MNQTGRAILAALTEISGIGDSRARELYNHFEDPKELIDPPKSIISDFHYVGPDTYAKLETFERLVKDYRRQLKQYAQDGIEVLAITEERYPQAAREGPAPVLLYAKGNIDLLKKQTVGVSGSRETNQQGREWIRSLASDLASDGRVIVSGGARGADTAAHRGALDSLASTIVVLGTGANVAYPPENESLFESVVDSDGLVVSMRPPDAEPAQHAFLDRNQLIAALSELMVFVATDGSGGTMAQYEIAVEQSLPVYVAPPDVGIQPSNGLSTIRDSDSAQIVDTPADIYDSSLKQDRQSDFSDWV